MPTTSVNGIDINYRIEGDGPETIVLVNGLGDDLETWVFQMEDLLGAGYRVLRFDNRGVGQTSAPPGPYTSRMLADDTRALVDELGLTGFHMLGVSMGGMIAQEYAINHGDTLKTVTLSCTYAAPGPFCSRMFAMWADMAPVNGVPFIMRDVTLWAFTLPFFEEQEDTLKEFEAGMAELPMSVEAYLAQLSVDPDARHDGSSRPHHGADARIERRGGHPDPGPPRETPPGGDRWGRLGDFDRRTRVHVGAPRRIQPRVPRLAGRSPELTYGKGGQRCRTTKHVRRRRSRRASSGATSRGGSSSVARPASPGPH